MSENIYDMNTIFFLRKIQNSLQFLSSFYLNVKFLHF